MKIKNAILLLLVTVLLQGCFLTKVVTVPMRAVGAVISIVPVVGNTIHDTIDASADAVDIIPI